MEGGVEALQLLEVADRVERLHEKRLVELIQRPLRFARVGVAVHPQHVPDLEGEELGAVEAAVRHRLPILAVLREDFSQLSLTVKNLLSPISNNSTKKKKGTNQSMVIVVENHYR